MCMDGHLGVLCWCGRQPAPPLLMAPWSSPRLRVEQTRACSSHPYLQHQWQWRAAAAAAATAAQLHSVVPAPARRQPARRQAPTGRQLHLKARQQAAGAQGPAVHALTRPWCQAAAQARVVAAAAPAVKAAVAAAVVPAAAAAAAAATTARAVLGMAVASNRSSDATRGGSRWVGRHRWRARAGGMLGDSCERA